MESVSKKKRKVAAEVFAEKVGFRHGWKSRPNGGDEW